MSQISFTQQDCIWCQSNVQVTFFHDKKHCLPCQPSITVGPNSSICQLTIKTRYLGFSIPACIYHISISPAMLGLFFNGDPLLLHSMDPAPIQLLTIYCELNRCIFITESCNWNHDHLQKKWIIWNTEKLPLKSSTKGANHSFDRGHKRIINS